MRMIEKWFLSRVLGAVKSAPQIPASMQSFMKGREKKRMCSPQSRTYQNRTPRNVVKGDPKRVQNTTSPHWDTGDSGKWSPISKERKKEEKMKEIDRLFYWWVIWAGLHLRGSSRINPQMSSNHGKAKGAVSGEKTKLNTGELYVHYSMWYGLTGSHFDKTIVMKTLAFNCFII